MERREGGGSYILVASAGFARFRALQLGMRNEQIRKNGRNRVEAVAKTGRQRKTYITTLMPSLTAIFTHIALVRFRAIGSFVAGLVAVPIYWSQTRQGNEENDECYSQPRRPPNRTPKSKHCNLTHSPTRQIVRHRTFSNPMPRLSTPLTPKPRIRLITFIGSMSRLLIAATNHVWVRLRAITLLVAFFPAVTTGLRFSTVGDFVAFLAAAFAARAHAVFVAVGADTVAAGGGRKRDRVSEVRYPIVEPLQSPNPKGKQKHNCINIPVFMRPVPGTFPNITLLPLLRTILDTMIFRTCTNNQSTLHKKQNQRFQHLPHRLHPPTVRTFCC